MIRIRPVEPRDADRWAALRAALWPEEDPRALAHDVARFFSEPRRDVGAMPEGALIAETEDCTRAVGFAEVSRRLYAEGCETSPVGFASDAVADNGLSATAHLALGFEEVVIVRCFRKDLC